MKTTITFLILICFTLQLSAQWKSLGAGTIDNHNQNMVITVRQGQDGSLWSIVFNKDYSPTQEYLKSTDGGNTITSHSLPVEDPNLGVFDIYALDQNTAWITAFHRTNFSYGKLFKTTDGGNTWIDQTPEYGDGIITNVYFWNDNEGLLYLSETSGNQDRMGMWATSDGGNTWTATTPSSVEAGDALWINVANGHYEVVGDTFWVGTRLGKVFKSTDKGQTWTVSQTGLTNATISSIAFKNELEGIAVSSINRAGFQANNQAVRTLDGGLTWTAINIPTDLTCISLEYVPNTLNTYIMTDGWYSKGIAYTTDGGEFWTMAEEETPGVSLLMISPTEGYIGGDIDGVGIGGLHRFISSFASDHVNITTIAGNGAEGFKMGKAIKSNLYNPDGMALDEAGNLYVANDHAGTIVKMSPDGDLSKFAGIPTTSLSEGDLDGLLDSAYFNRPSAIAFDEAGDMYIADANNCKIKKITFSDGAETVSTYAGTGTIASIDGSLESASFLFPQCLHFDSQGNLIVADDAALRKITPDGMVTTIAGSSTPGNQDGMGSEASFNGLWSMDLDSQDNIYVSDIFNHMIRKITPEGIVTTIAGSGTPGYQDGEAETAQFYYPEGIAVTPAGEIYIADGANGFIRKLDTLGMVSSVAGTEHGAYPFGPGQPSPEVVDGDGDHAVLSRSRDLLLLPNGNLLVSEWGDRIREIQFGLPSSPLLYKKEITNPYAINHINHQEGFAINGVVENISEEEINEVKLEVKVFREGALRFFKNSESISVGASETGILELAEAFTPNTAGIYEVEMTYSIEGETQKVLYDQIVVSDSILAQDDGFYYLFGEYSPFFNGFENAYGMAYEINVADSLTAIQALIGTLSNRVQFSLWQMDGNVVAERIYASDTIVITPAVEEHYSPFASGYFLDWQTYAFDTPIDLQAGRYLLSIQAFDNFLLIGADNNKDSPNNYVIDENGWTSVSSLYGNDLLMMIRPVFGEVPMTVAAPKLDLTLLNIQASPNPFTETLQLTWNEPQRLLISLFDVKGNLLHRQRVVGQEATLEGLKDLPAGGYVIFVEGDKIRQGIRVMKAQ